MASHHKSEHDAQRMRANDKGRIQDLEERLTALVTSSDRLELLGAILDAFDNTIVVTDPDKLDNPIIYVNGGFEKLTGYGPGEVIGYNCRFLQGEDRDQEGVKQLREAVRAGESIDVELRNYRKDGAMFWNHLYLSPVYDEEGKLVLFLGVQNDVTARKEATEEVKRARDTLEQRILERTGELDESNRELRLEIQARERAEREVRASEGKLLDVLDHLLTFVAVLDPGSTLQYVNRATLDASDATLATVIGLPFAETPWWRYDSAVQTRLRDAIQRATQGEASRYDERMQMSERVLTVDFMLEPLRDKTGNVTALVASAADVSERERAREALQETTERLQLLVSEAKDYAIIITDPNGIITEWNPGAERIVGQREEEVLGRHIDLIFTPQDTEEGRAETEMRIARDEGSAKDVRWHLRRDGTRFFADGTTTALRNDTGELRGFAKVFRDDTEQKLAEETLRRSEEQRRAALEAAAMGTWDIDIVNGTFNMDKRGRELFDLPSEGSLSLEKAISHIHPDERDDVAQQVEEVTRSSETGNYDLEYRVLKPEGGVRWIRATGQALFEGAGAERRAVRFVGVLTETTQRKEMEEALRKSEERLKNVNEELEQRVEERTAGLEAANKELEAFSYSVSHDLRAPLRGIDGFSQALLEDCGVGDTLDETGIHYLQRVRAGAQRMGTLIDDMLAFSRLSRSEMTREAVDLSAKAESIAADLREREPERDVLFEIQPGLGAPGDRRLLRIALTNLFENAWKFTRHEEEAHISFGVNEEGTFFVRDNGAGFDMAYAHKLFGAFQRLHSPGQFEGTGIGLATVQRVILRHGGALWAEAAVGEGATFYFTLQGLRM